MTDYDFLIEHSFKYLLRYKLLTGGDLRKKKKLERNRKLVRYGVYYGDFLTMTFISENGIKTNIYSGYDYNRAVPIFSVKPKFLDREIFYIHDISKGYPIPENFGDIIDRISSVSLDYSSDVYIVSQFLSEEDPMVAYKEETGMKLSLGKISSLFSRWVRVFHNSPVKPENLRELLRLENRLLGCMNPGKLTEEEIIRFMRDNVFMRAKEANNEFRVIMEGIKTELSLRYEVPESMIGRPI